MALHTQSNLQETLATMISANKINDVTDTINTFINAHDSSHQPLRIPKLRHHLSLVMNERVTVDQVTKIVHVLQVDPEYRSKFSYLLHLQTSDQFDEMLEYMLPYTNIKPVGERLLAYLEANATMTPTEFSTVGISELEKLFPAQLDDGDMLYLLYAASLISDEYEHIISNLIDLNELFMTPTTDTVISELLPDATNIDTVVSALTEYIQNIRQTKSPLREPHFHHAFEEILQQDISLDDANRILMSILSDTGKFDMLKHQLVFEDDDLTEELTHWVGAASASAIQTELLTYIKANAHTDTTAFVQNIYPAFKKIIPVNISNIAIDDILKYISTHSLAHSEILSEKYYSEAGFAARPK